MFLIIRVNNVCFVSMSHLYYTRLTILYTRIRTLRVAEGGDCTESKSKNVFCDQSFVLYRACLKRIFIDPYRVLKIWLQELLCFLSFIVVCALCIVLIVDCDF